MVKIPPNGLARGPPPGVFAMGPDEAVAFAAPVEHVGPGGNTIDTVLVISSGVLIFGLFSPWSWYGFTGFERLQYSFSDMEYLLTLGNQWTCGYESCGLYEWMTPLRYIERLVYYLLPLVFVTTFVATWYKSRQGDEEFGRKASTFHLSFFGIYYLINILAWGGSEYLVSVFPEAWDYGMWIAAASGIGLHPTAYGLEERFFSQPDKLLGGGD